MKVFYKGLAFVALGEKKSLSTSSSESYLCASKWTVAGATVSSEQLFATRDRHIIYIKHTITSCNLNSLIRCLVGVASCNSTWLNPNQRLLRAWLKPPWFHYCYSQTGPLQFYLEYTKALMIRPYRYEYYITSNYNLVAWPQKPGRLSLLILSDVWIRQRKTGFRSYVIISLGTNQVSTKIRCCTHRDIIIFADNNDTTWYREIREL